MLLPFCENLGWNSKNMSIIDKKKDFYDCDLNFYDCADLVLSKKALTQEKVDFYSRKSLWNHFLVMRIYSKNAYKSSVSAAYQGLKRFFRQMGLIMLSIAKHAHNFSWLELDPFFNKTARAIIKASPVRGMSKVVSHLSIYFFYSHQTRSMQHVY